MTAAKRVALLGLSGQMVEVGSGSQHRSGGATRVRRREGCRSGVPRGWGQAGLRVVVRRVGMGVGDSLQGRRRLALERSQAN